MRLATFGRSSISEGYPPTAVRNLEWSNNTFGPSTGRVRSKWICPAGCTCDDLIVVGNSQPPNSTWQCGWPGSFTVRGNSPPGLSGCMRRGARRAADHRGGEKDGRSSNWRGGGRGGRKGKGKGARKNKRGARQGGGLGPAVARSRNRKFDWETGTFSWSAGGET